MTGSGAGDVRAFYDRLAPLYHLVYEDWDASVRRQRDALAALIVERWGSAARVVLDAAAGIGTQALGLLMRGFEVIGSDLSLGAMRRGVSASPPRERGGHPGRATRVLPLRPAWRWLRDLDA